MTWIRNALLAGLLAPAVAMAQTSTVTRRDLADAYLVIDRLVTTRGIPAPQRADWNRAFDQTTLAFFGGDFARVLRQMHDLTSRIVGDSGIGSASRQLLALRLTATPRVLAPSDSSVALSVTVMYGDSISSAPRPLTLRVLDASGREVLRRTLTVPGQVPTGSTHSVRLSRSELQLARGSYRVEASLNAAALALSAPLFVLEASAASTRARLEQRLLRVEARAGVQTLASVRARLALLSDEPDENNSAQFLSDPVQLANALEREITAIESGSDPYAEAGDRWRVLKMPNGLVPFRSYVPAASRNAGARPVVIALHGAGADENMFFEGYGAGQLRALADSANVVLLSPLTTAFVREPGTLDSALALLARSTNIDRNRVYLIGHSMGGAAAIRLGVESRERIRALVVLTGTGVLPAGAGIPPTLFVAAETDLVIPITRVRVTYDQFLAAGAPVEYELAEGWGHTLIVGAHLERALRWLLQR
jgi:predicted esterase